MSAQPSQSNRVHASARESGAVTPSDTTELSFDALYVGTTGNIALKHIEGGAAVTFSNVGAGAILPVTGVRVMAATTASSILWLRW